MAVNCSLVNRETKQPIPFYNVNGEYFREFSDAIKSAEEGQQINVSLLNTDSVVEVFSEQDFQSKIDGDVVIFGNKLKLNKNSVEKVVAKIPVTFDTKTKEGVVNTLIKANILSPFTENFNGEKYYSPFGIDENTQSVNAETLALELTAMVGKDGFIREGNAFRILGRQDVTPTQEGKVFLEIDAKSNSTPTITPTLDTNESLNSLISNFLNEVGIDVVSIEEYKKRYAQKNGISPDAKGLADIANSVIALSNNEVIDESVITEEMAHFIVEGMPETESLLDDVVGTKEWAKHSERYRQIYGESISDPVELERAVKKEILGKILANGIREDFNSEQMNSKDASVFERLWEGFLNFIEKIVSNKREGQTKRVKDFTKRVGVLLKNKELADKIDANNFNNSLLPPMYSLSENSPLRKLTKSIEKTIRDAVSNNNKEYVKALERGVYDRLSDALEGATLLQDEDFNLQRKVLANVSLLTEIVSTQTTAMLDELSHTEEGTILNQEIGQKFSAINDLLVEPLETIMVRLNEDLQKGKFDEESSYAKAVLSNLEQVMSSVTYLKGSINKKRVLDKEFIVDRIVEDQGRKGDSVFRNKILDWVNGVFKEQGWLQTFLGRASQSSNPYVKRIAQIAHDNYSKTMDFMSKEVKPILQRLDKNRERLGELLNKETGELTGHISDKKQKQREAQLSEIAKNLTDKYFGNNKYFKDSVVLTDEDIETLKEGFFSQRVFEEILRDKISIRAQELLTTLKPEEYNSIPLLNENEASLSKDGVQLFKTIKTDYAFASAEVNINLGRKGKASVERLKARVELFKNGFNGYTLSKETFLKEQDRSARRGELFGKLPRDENDFIDGGNPAIKKYDADLQAIKSERIKEKSVFAKDGSVKYGFERYDGVSPLKKGEYLYKVNDEVSYVLNTNLNGDISEAKLAYDLYALDEHAKKVNEESGTPLFPEGDVDYLEAQLERYVNELRSKGLKERDVNKRAYEWFKRNASIAFTDVYTNQFDDLEGYEDSVRSLVGDNLEVNADLNLISENKAKIRAIINTAKSFLDYREIRPQDLDATAREQIDDLEAENALLRKKINKYIKDNNQGELIVDFGGGNIINMAQFFNNEFYNQFYAKNGVEWENAIEQTKTDWLLDKQKGDVENYYAYKNKWLKLLQGQSEIEITPEVEKKLGKYFILETPGRMTQKDVELNLQRYLLSGVPQYWKRTTPIEYNELNRKLELGELNILEDVVRNQEGSLGSMMSIKPFYSMVEEDETVFKLSEHIFERKMAQINNTNYSSKREMLRDKYEAYMHIAGRDFINIEKEDVNKEFLDKFGIEVEEDGLQIKFSAPTKNIELFESLIDLMELNRMGLKNYGELNKRSIFTMPQNRKSNTERFFDRGAREFVSEWVKDLSVREEDEAGQNQKRRKNDISEMFVIPRQGLSRVPIEDLSFDAMWSFAKFAHDGKEYRSRKDSLDEAVATRESISTLSFKDGKNWKETNDYKMATNTINAQFLGQSPIYEAFITLPNGQKIDMAKVASRFRRYVSANNLMFAPLVAMTSAVTATLNKALARASNYNLYSPASTRASKEFMKMAGGGISDMGKVLSTSDIDAIGEFAGLYNMLERTENSKYGFKKNFYDLEKLGYSIHSMANYAISPRVVLSKLMEYRTITDPEIEADGVVMNWSNFLERKKMSNPNLTKAEIQKQFESFSGNSFYDMLVTENGITKIDIEKAKALGVKSENIQEYLEILQRKVSRDVQSAIATYDGVIHASQTTEGQRHPLMSFLFLHKAWFVIASEKVFGSGGFDMNTGNFEDSVFKSIKEMMVESFLKKDEITGKYKFTFDKDGWNRLTEAQKSANRYAFANAGAITALVFLASALIGYADDDDEGSVWKEMMATLAVRTLGETASATFGMPSEYYSLLESPVVPLNTIENFWKLTHLGNINKEVTKGMYAGQNKYLNNILKLTFFKNLYMYQDADHIAENRKGYMYFADEGGLYNFISIAKWLSKDE